MSETTKPAAIAAGQKPAGEAKAAGEARPSVKPATQERFIPASESRFGSDVAFSFPEVSYVPEAGTPLEHVLRPEYWANLKKLKAGCRIFVYAEDESYCAQLLVRKVGQGYAKVQLLHHHELAQRGIDPKVPDGYEIEFRGPITKHRIVRLKDGSVLKQGLDTYEEASAWLREHKRMLAA